MVEVSESAKAQLDEVFKDAPASPIRITVVGGSGPETLGMSLEPAKEGDVSYTVNGYEFLLPVELTEKASYFRLGYAGGEFSLDSDIPLKEEGSCSGHHHHHDHDGGHHCH